MYFCYLRARQNELLALRELVNQDKLSEKLIPIIEPIKINTTFIKTVDSFIQHNHKIGIVINPTEENFIMNLSEEEKKKFLQLFENNLCKKTIILKQDIRNALIEIGDFSNSYLIATDVDNIKLYEEYFTNNIPMYVLMPDERTIKRTIKNNRVLLEDRFNKKTRNVDYYEKEDEFFSDNHLYYREEGYVGFGDYSIIGNDVQKGGFAPMAVAIHIVYFDKEKNLRIHHFISNSNEDIKNTAKKFYEADEKLVLWLEQHNDVYETIGLKEFKSSYEKERYPGLGSVKKFSIMHHLELMSRYLDGDIK